MPSYQSPRKSFLALLLTQIEAMPDDALSSDARKCLVDYARYLEGRGLARGGDHMLAGLLLNACELVTYLPGGKLGKGSMELTRLQERVERVLTAERRAEKRRRPAEERDIPRRQVPRPGPQDLNQAPFSEDDEQEQIDNQAADAARGEA